MAETRERIYSSDPIPEPKKGGHWTTGFKVELAIWIRRNANRLGELMSKFKMSQEEVDEVLRNEEKNRQKTHKVASAVAASNRSRKTR